ncbi:YncE family protein [Algibacter amylolyticus]|uniref:YncE family protein n=1 Tax=Algibacter amylolyticus TaxID=1608400 RepID=A0A5M7B1K7_9FLAO|nr:DUF5074 domain-containing protein [Algibacter amylolyticus]KAA5823523.1 YncE family protein [Algibacter amylolyticus]MBB5267675.1 YVTN family beta-propeller protein [Algibacter amylolyticus]TSJ74011.1 YncE family protein [Algibacter amylolyticus]
MKINKLLVLALLTSIFITSCSEDSDDNPVVPKGDYENGLIVSHEGNFGQGNASVSFVSDDFLTVENNVFSNVNGAPLGDTAQSITFSDDLAYIVLNVSNKIEVVNRYTFESVATINSGLVNPRYMTISNGKGYVTNWGDGGDSTDDFVAVIDLATNTVSNTIHVGEGPEYILEKGYMLYVSHKGGWGVNNIISVIDTTDNNVGTLEVNDAPGAMAFDSNGNLVVLCSGANQYWLTPAVETLASITRISTNNSAILDVMEFASGEHPSIMTHDDDELFYILNGEVYELEDSSDALPTTAILDVSSTSAYGISVEDDTLYVANSNFTEESDLLIYDLDSASLMETIELSIGAAKIYFN